MESKKFKERLIEFARKQYDMGQTNFEAFAGLASGSINKIRSGISTSSLAKIAERCPELNLRWLLLGEGRMTEAAAEAGGHVTTIGSVSGRTGSHVTVNGTVNGDPERAGGALRAVEALSEENRALTRQIEALTAIIARLTEKG